MDKGHTSRRYLDNCIAYGLCYWCLCRDERGFSTEIVNKRQRLFTTMLFVVDLA